MRQSYVAMRNTAAGFLSQAVSMVLTVVLVPFIVHRVGDEAYGVVLLAQSIITILQILRNPVAQTCTVAVARGHELGDDARASRTLSAAVVFCLIPAGLGFLFMAGGAEAIYRFFDIGPSLHRETLAVLILAGLMILVVFPLFPIQGILYGLQRHDLAYLIYGVSEVLRAGVVVVFILFVSRSVVLVMLVQVLAEVGIQVATVAVARRLAPSLRLRLRGLRREDFRPLATFGSLVLATQLLLTLNQHTSRWIAGKALGVDQITSLWVATMVVQLAYRLVLQVTVVLAPIATRYHARQEAASLQQVLHRGSRYAFIMAAAAVASLLPVMDVFLRLWMGEAYVWLAPYAVALGAVTIVTASSSSSLQVLQGMGNARLPFVSILISFVGGAAVMILGVTVLDAGFAGITAGLCAEQVLRWVIMSRLAVREVQGSWGRLLWTAYAQPMLAVVPAVGVVLVLKHFAAPATWTGLLLVLACGSAVFVAALLPLLTGAEWELLRAGLAWVRRKVGRADPPPPPA